MDEHTLRTPPEAPGYEFLQAIAAGGTSMVWLARQLSLDRIVAIKVLDASLLADEEERERFEAEAKAAAQLDLPAIVRVLDFGEANGTLYYVMEYVEGTSLADWLRAHGRMSPVQALQVAEIIASAMGAAWDKAGLVHGDIKPGNVLLGQDGAVKLTDLGLARLTARQKGLARADGTVPGESAGGEWTLQGTPTYLAPEQVGGAPASVQSDIYSLGLTLYHLLTGVVPFEGLGVEELLAAQLNDYLPDPCDIEGIKVSVGTAWLLAKMTAKEPSQRHDGWAALLADLEKVQGGGRPSGPFPGETESTILLSPAHRPGARGNTINLSAAGRKAIVLTATPRNAPMDIRRGVAADRARMKGASGGGFLKFLGFLVFLALVGVGVWLGVFKSHPERWEELKGAFSAKKPAARKIVEAPMQGRSPGEGKTEGAGAADGGEKDTHELVKIPAAGAANDRGTEVEGAWADERYVAAATQFNEALKKYQSALEAKAEPGDETWPEVAREAAAAAEALDALRPGAPEGVPLREYANMAYQLVKDARRAAFTEEDKRAAWRQAPKRRHPSATPWPTPPKDENSLFSDGRIQLGYAWDVLPAPASDLSIEWLSMVAGQASSAPNTVGDASLRFVGPISFMMDVREAAQRMGQPLPVRQALTNGIFPYGGVFGYQLNAKAYGNIRRPNRPYPKMMLLADADDQLIGLFLVDDEPTNLVHSVDMFSPSSRVADFVMGETLEDGSEVRPYHQLLLGEGVVRVDSETADLAASPPKAIRQSTLIISKSLLDCLFYHVMGSSN